MKRQNRQITKLISLLKFPGLQYLLASPALPGHSRSALNFGASRLWQAPLSFLAWRSLKPEMNSRKDCSSIALAALPGHSRFARLVRVRDVDDLSGNTLLFFALMLALKKASRYW